MERIGVVGGSGFVGGSIARELSKDFEVVVIDLKEPQRPSENVEFCKCDVRSFEQVMECLRGVDLVIHSAIIQIPRINEEKRLGYEVNFVGTQNICEAVYRGKVRLKV